MNNIWKKSVSTMHIFPLTSYFLTSSFMPHGMCYLWKPWLVGLHIVSNSVIGLSYFSIPVTLVHIVRQRQDIPFNWIPQLFAAFIICCGIGHLMDIWTLWHPNYWLAIYIRVVTGIVSLATAIALFYLIPKLMALPSRKQIEETNQRLVAEIQERKQVQLELAKLNQELEARVEQRTAQLAVANQQKDHLIAQERNYRQEIEIYKHIIDNIPLGLLVWNLKKTDDASSLSLVTANPAASDILKIDMQAEIGRTIGEAFPNMVTEDCHDLLHTYSWVATSKEAKIIESVNYSDERLQPTVFALKVFPIPNHHLGVAFEDISDRKRMETALAESERLYTSVVNSVDEVIFQTDIQGNWTFLSPAWETVTGFPVSASLYQNFTDLMVTATEKQRTQELFQSLINGSQETYQIDFLIQNQQGEPRWLEMYAQPKTDSYGNITGVWGTINDITQRKQAEELIALRAQELAQANNQLVKITTELERRNAELDQFAYVTSHDLKAPLRAIANLSQWIEEDLADKLTDDTRHQMHLLRSRVNRMDALINGILQYSRIGRITNQPEEVEISQLLAEIIDSLAPPPTFTIAIAKNMPTITTERLPLQMVFTNLISNAIKHHPRIDGCIHITYQEKNEYYEFSIADDGLGIAPEFHDKIFTIFQTLDSRDNTENTGIGLSIVKKIVETQGGTIRLVSQPNCGANFLFTWKK